MRFLFDECLWLNSRKFQANTLACINGQVQVLLSLIDVHVLLCVNSFRENCIFNSNVHKLGKHNTSFETMEQIIVFRINGNKFFAVLISIKEFIDQLGKANPFFDQISVSESTFSDTLRYLTTNIKYYYYLPSLDCHNFGKLLRILEFELLEHLNNY